MLMNHKQNRQIRTVFALVASFVLTLCSWPALAFAPNDPVQICKADGGKTWYFSLGREVFEITNPDYSNGGPLVDNVDARYALIPPNPASPIGCKGNPQQLREFSSLNWPRLEPDKYTGNMPPTTDLVELIRYPYSNTVTPNVDPVIFGLEIVANKCQNKKIIKRWGNGTFLCTNQEGQLNSMLTDPPYQVGAGWEFIISGNLYLTPLGQNLVMNGESNHVDVSYLLTPDILLNYKWYPPRSASHIDPAYLIRVDRLFRAKLSTYQVESFPWPQQPLNKSKK
jgi:hypothetical protein